MPISGDGISGAPISAAGGSSSGGGSGLGGMGCCCTGACTCNATICVTDCSGTPLTGCLVTCGTLGTMSTAPGSCATFCIGSSGSFLVTISKAGWQTFVGTLALTCGGVVTVGLLSPGTFSVCFTVTGCWVGLGGALCTFSGTAGSSTCTTDSSGHCCSTFSAPGTYSWSVSKSRFTTQSGTLVITACGGAEVDIHVTLLAASGFACAPCNPALNDPVKTTLSLTDGVAGGGSLVYSAITGLWSGSIAYAFPGFCGMGVISATMFYSWPVGGTGIAGASCGCAVSVTDSTPHYVTTTPSVVDHGSCLIGTGNTGKLVGVNTCQCPAPPFGQPAYLCCGNNGCRCVSSVLNSAVPLDVQTTLTACGCIFTAATNVWDCEDAMGATTFGCCYGAGSAPVLTLTE